MARFSDDELEELKRKVDLAALVRSKGIELKPHGSKDLVGLSPFTAEKTPSFIVTPEKNLWHCMSSGQGGSVIDFVMKHDGVSFRHAVLLLKEQNPQLFGGKALSKATVPKLEAPVSPDGDDQALFSQVLEYYQRRLIENPAALDYLKSRGLTEEAMKAFGIGFGDRTLGLRLPHKNRTEGKAIRERLQRLGLFRSSGHEHFNGCVVFPLRNKSGEVVEVYGRKIGPQVSKVYHLYLPGPHGGIFNPESLKSPELILCESVIDAVSFWCAGLRHVTCIYGTEGFCDELFEAIQRHRTKRVYLAYDRDKAGDRAAERDAKRLGEVGIECFRVLFPQGMDANKYALKVTPASKSLRALITGAQWLGKGRRSSSSAPQEGKVVSQKPEVSPSSSTELAAKVSCSSVEAAEVENVETVAEATIAKTEELATKDKMADGVLVKHEGEDVFFELGDRQYRVRGLHKNTSFEVLKINLRVWFNERYHIDTLDFYRAKDRAAFVSIAADETGLKAELLKRDLGKVLLKLEALQEAKLKEDLEPQTQQVEMATADKKEAMALLKRPDLLERILSDFEKCGIVGESTNKLTGYLAAVSRKLDRPLAIIIQSTSAAGKTSLMEAVLEMMPEEERVKYSAMTGQSLYYLGETNLKHKILAIVEEEGAEKASYALKLLQSEGELTIASTGKDDNGRMKTEEYHVEGPVMIFLTTTAIDIDEELLNRCLVLTVDESRSQTEAIHQLQREAETFDGLKRKVRREAILRVHRNAQRLLKPLHVVNPFAPWLTFLSDRTRTRRDHLKYLTLIRTIALLHQHQRPVHERDGMKHIEVSLDDIEAANRIAHEVLGRSLDELPPQTRRLLTLLKKEVKLRCQAEGLEQDQCLFTRRQVREWSGWTEFQVRTHLTKLETLEYILPHYGGRGQSFVYELLFDGNSETHKPQLNGLLDVGKLREKVSTISTSSIETEPSSPQRASIEQGSRWVRDPGKASIDAGSDPKSRPNGANGHKHENLEVIVS